jgi:putative PLP-dependent aminotransferase (TIGR04422 family)
MIGIWRSVIRKPSASSAKIKDILNISKKIEKLFPNSNPLLINSARIAIYLALKAQKCTREKFISYAPYSSSCLLKTIAEIGSPIPSNKSSKVKIFSQILYHQWGFFKKTTHDSKIIEDSVDSFILNENALFRNKSDYEIISLSKLFGLSSGSIIFCKKKELKEKIVEILINENYYENIEIFYKNENLLPSYYKNLYLLNPFVSNHIINKTEEILNNYKKISEVKIYRNQLFKKIFPEELLTEKNRLPTAIPLIISKEKIKAIKKITTLKNDYLHFNFSPMSSKWVLKKVFPLPIHEDISLANLKKILNIIEK